MKPVKRANVPVVVVTLIAFALPLLLRQFVPQGFLPAPPFLKPLLMILVSILCTSLIVWILGITSSERRHLLAHLRKTLRLPQN